MDLSDYVEIKPTKDNEPDLVKEVEEALQWFASTPEGLQKLQAAYDVEGKPVTVLVGSNVVKNGFVEYEGERCVTLNPPQTNQDFFISEAGQKESFGLRRTIVHEFVHAGQLGLEESNNRFMKEQNRISDDVYLPYWKQVVKLLKGEKLKGMSSDERRAIATNAYDAVFTKHWDAICSEFYSKMSESAIIAEHVENIESPAITFENEMAKKYGLGPKRLEDYVKSSSPTESHRRMIRDMHINALLDEIEKKHSVDGKDAHFWRELVAKGKGRSQSPAFEVRGRA